MSNQELDRVEWELVRADIAMEKARLKANGDWAKWEKFQAQANARLGIHPRRGQGGSEQERIESWWASALRRLRR